MSSLTNQYIDDAYPGLLHANAAELPATGQQAIYDGNGNTSAISLGRACNGATICGTLTVDDLNIGTTSFLDKVYPVGSIYFSIYEVTTLFGGWGTWSRVAEGRFIAGQGTGTDGGGSSATITTGNDGTGRYTHTLTVDELAIHTHEAGTLTTASGGEHTHTLQMGARNSSSSGGANEWPPQTGNGDSSYTATNSVLSAGAHTHSITGATASSGSGNPHNNTPPAFGLYIYQRTA